MLNVCLFEPEIPQNTGNIARTCSDTGAVLHLVHPLGFSIDEKAVRRAGLDYWDGVTIVEYGSIGEFMEKHKNDNLYFFSQKGSTCYSDITYSNDEDIYLIFGKESSGLDDNLLMANMDRCLRIPMLENRRCLNLSNSVAVAVYEVLRQGGFKGLEKKGKMKGMREDRN